MIDVVFRIGQRTDLLGPPTLFLCPVRARAKNEQGGRDFEPRNLEEAQQQRGSVAMTPVDMTSSYLPIVALSTGIQSMLGVNFILRAKMRMGTTQNKG